MKVRVLRFLALMTILALALSNSGLSALAQPQSAAEAFQAAIDAYNQRHQLDFAITDLHEAGSLAYASAARPHPQREADALFLLAEDRGAQGWQVLVPGVSQAADYNRLLNAFPQDVLDEGMKAFYSQPEDQVDGNNDFLMANYTGHRLPWPAGKSGYVTQRDGDSHQSQVDFDIQGLAASGDVYASKPGTVVFVKDSSSTTCQSGATCWKKSNMVVVQHASGEYSWYVHLAYQSAAVSVGQQIGYGTKIGVEGETGYSFGVHLHYMASSGRTTWTDPSNPDDAPWATGINPVDFDEYPWDGLIVTYSSTYMSQNRPDLPVCPAAGGVLLYRDASYGCGGLLENAGYSFRNEPGFQNLPVSFNEQASSIRVPSGWSVLLYENADRAGGKKCIESPGKETFAGDSFDNGTSLNERVSSYEVFSAPGCPVRQPADTTPPTGTLTSPASGSTVGRIMPLVATAADNSAGVRQVAFLATWGGQQRVVFTDTTAPYSFNWDLCTAGVPDGTIDLSIQVLDNARNQMSSTAITVTKKYDCAAKPGGAWSVDYWPNLDLSGSPALHAEVADPLLFFDWGSGSPGPGIPADGWGARFTRTYYFPGGEYYFHCEAADVCRIYLDGSQQAFSSNDWIGTIAAGSHEVRVEYFDLGGDARLEAWWRGAGFLPEDAICATDQWCVNYWGNNRLQGTPAAQLEEGEMLRHVWDLTGPDPMLPGGHFGSMAYRSVAFDCGTYRFHADTADAVRVLVDETLRIDAWSEPSQPANHSAEVPLTRGTHYLRIEHAASGTASLHVWWEQTASCPVSTVIDSVSSHVARPGTVIQPQVRAQVTEGNLDPARADGLTFAGGSQMGGVSPQLVDRFVDAGQSYLFDGLKLTAPSANGTHTSQWQVRAGGSAASPNVPIRVLVDGSAPQARITSPGGYLTTATIPVRAAITDSGSGVTHAQFMAGYDSGSGGWAWRSLGWDFNGNDGWGMDWNTAGIPDQSKIIFLVQVWDRAGNAAWDQYSNAGEARTGELTLDRNPPTASITPLSPAQNSTRFLVEWSGSDNISGVHHYNVQVVDNGSTRAWLNEVPELTRGAWFDGEMGHTYSFRVQAVDAAGNIGAYSSPSNTTLVNTCSPDSYEPDGEPARGTGRSVADGAQEHNLCGTGDVDWFSFTALAGKAYMIRANALSATTDTVLSLYAADGQTLLAENDSSATAGSSLVWYSENGGLFYFNVRHASPNVAGNAVTYSVQIEDANITFVPLVRR